jgi:hypothetical protein
MDGSPLLGGPSSFSQQEGSMARVTWVKIASWHVLKFDDPASTVCGLEVSEEDEIFEGLPTDWLKTKSCETCLRIKEAKAEQEISLIP